jgi:hypothetical protein
MIFLIFASQVARIAGIRHQCLRIFKIHLLSANYMPGTSEGTKDTKMKIYYPFLLINLWDPMPRR